MFIRLLTLTFRNLRRNLLYTFIVVGGLAFGISTLLATIQWSVWHISYDKHFPNSKDIYRLSLEENRENFERHTARIIHGDVVHQLYSESEIPDIQKIARLAPFRNAIVQKNELVFYEDKSYACDPAFIEIFQPEMLIGDPMKVLDEPYKVILSEETAKKYFGDENPVGQSLEIVHQFGYQGDAFEITGVFKQFPENTHFKIELLTSFDDPDSYQGTAWVYLNLFDGVDIEALENQVMDFIVANNEEDYSMGLSPHILPLKDIHLKSHLARELDLNVHMQTLLVIFVAGLLVFILAWFNFTLLAISQNQLNLKKLIYQWQMGAGKRIFFSQFFVEFITIGVLSFLIGIVLIFIVNAPLENILRVSIAENKGLLIISLISIILLLLISSLITALFATQRLYRILKYRYFYSKSNSSRTMNSKTWFIRAVIIIEFIITFALVTNLFTINEQVKYSISQQIGANDSSTLQLYNLPRPVIDKYALFKNELMKYPVIEEITAMMEEPGGSAMDAFPYRIEGLPETENLLFVFPVDEDFLRFYDLEIIEGRDFPLSYNTEDTTEYFILNETAAKIIGLDSYSGIIERELKIDFAAEGFIYPGNIIGVIEDFHLSSMENGVNPMVIFPEYTWLYCISIRINGDPQDAVTAIRKEWKELFPNYPLQYSFTNDIYQELYSTQLTELKILIIFSILSLLIAGTGLFAISSFFMHQKTHAAALRKINGARIRQILVPELMQYLYLALISALLAIPISWYTIHKWLSNFEYQTSIPLWIFPLTGLFLITFSWLSVIYHSIRLARINPIDFIRNE